jgi:hypothetical protein
MLTPVAPAAGLVERTSSPVVVVKVQLEALPMGTLSKDWTDPLTDAVYAVPDASGVVGVSVAVFDGPS